MLGSGNNTFIIELLAPHLHDDAYQAESLKQITRRSRAERWRRAINFEIINFIRSGTNALDRQGPRFPSLMRVGRGVWDNVRCVG